MTGVAVAKQRRRTRGRDEGRNMADMNREASDLADAISDPVEWSTDEPMPDLRALWDTAKATRTRPRVHRDKKNPYSYAWDYTREQKTHGYERDGR